MAATDGEGISAGTVHAATNRLADFADLAAFFTGWDGRFEQISAGRFEGRLQSVHGRAVRLVSLDCNQTILARGRGAPGLFSVYAVTPANAGCLWQGRRLSPGQVVVHGPDADTNHRSARRFTSIGFSIPAPEIAATARTLLAAEVAQLPSSWAALAPPRRDFAGLCDRLVGLLDLALATPAIIATAEWIVLEQECIRAVVRSVTGPPSGRGGTPRNQRAAVLRRAEELMRSRLHEPVGIVDLCQELGVSDRTLRLAFREQFGVGPMTFYRRIRLNATRAALKTAAWPSIAEVARRHGFYHLGNFAADYRRLFGERPSDTRSSAVPPGRR